MITCSKCGSRVGVTGPCRTCRKRKNEMNFMDVNPNENNEPKCAHGVNGGSRGGCSECPGGLNAESEVSMWVDTNSCNEHFHVIKRVDGKWKALHSDDEECDEAEYDVSDLAA